MRSQPGRLATQAGATAELADTCTQGTLSHDAVCAEHTSYEGGPQLQVHALKSMDLSVGTLLGNRHPR